MSYDDVGGNGVVYKTAKNTSGSELDTDVIIDDKQKTSYSITYKALINDMILDYDFATDMEENETKQQAVCLGKGVIAEVEATGQLNVTTIKVHSTNELYFWRTVTKDKNEELADHNDLIDIVNQDEKELTMKTIKPDAETNKILTAVKESGGDVDILIDYCKMSFANVFVDISKGADANTLGNDIQNQMTYIITEINNNDMLTDESRAKLVNAIEKESIEYQRLLESLTDVTTETKKLLDVEDSKSDDMSWGTMLLYTVGAIIAIGAAYSLYRYLEPEDIVLDMSTMSILNR